MFHQQTINKIKAALTRCQQSIAVAESVTSGLLQAALSTAEEAMRFYQGGITAYNIGQKARHLDIDPIHALDCNCVSEKMAQDMAQSACRMFTSEWGIGVTGYASPVPESDHKQFAWFAICHNHKVVVSHQINCAEGNPMDAQLFYVNTILDELAKLISE